MVSSLELVWKTGGRYYIPVINEPRENKHELSYGVKNCRSAAVDVRRENVCLSDRGEISPTGEREREGLAKVPHNACDSGVYSGLALCFSHRP